MHEIESIIGAPRIVPQLCCDVFSGAIIRGSPVKGCHSPNVHLAVTGKLRTLCHMPPTWLYLHPYVDTKGFRAILTVEIWKAI